MRIYMCFGLADTRKYSTGKQFVDFSACEHSYNFFSKSFLYEIKTIVDCDPPPVGRFCLGMLVFYIENKKHTLINQQLMRKSFDFEMIPMKKVCVGQILKIK